jgi:hypothetical protein
VPIEVGALPSAPIFHAARFPANGDINWENAHSASPTTASGTARFRFSPSRFTGAQQFDAVGHGISDSIRQTSSTNSRWLPPESTCHGSTDYFAAWPDVYPNLIIADLARSRR